MFDKFIVAFVGTLIIFAVLASCFFVGVISFKLFGLWGLPVFAVFIACVMGIVEMLPKTDVKP